MYLSIYSTLKYLSAVGSWLVVSSWRGSCPASGLYRTTGAGTCVPALRSGTERVSSRSLLLWSVECINTKIPVACKCQPAPQKIKPAHSVVFTSRLSLVSLLSSLHAPSLCSGGPRPCARRVLHRGPAPRDRHSQVVQQREGVRLHPPRHCLGRPE